MAGELENRRQELLDERTALESALRAITSAFMAPDDAALKFKITRFITSTDGSGGSTLRGQTVVDAITDRLKEIQRQLSSIPVIATRRIATVVDVVGNDLSQYSTS